VAAPVAGKIFSEVLPYLEISKEGEEEKQKVKVPDLIGKTILEAKKILKESNLEIKINEGEEKSEKLITKQIPEKDITVEEGSSIIVHME
jgi:beta-lactam-binding protein with PASTA domain